MQGHRRRPHSMMHDVRSEDQVLASWGLGIRDPVPRGASGVSPSLPTDNVLLATGGVTCCDPRPTE